MKVQPVSEPTPCGIQFISKPLENGTAIHHLKCVEPFYYEIDQERKKFELRKDDREVEYSVGDSLVLYQVKNGIITGNYIIRKVIYVLRFAEEYGLKAGHVIMSIK
jgi:hypothetical protein